MRIKEDINWHLVDELSNSWQHLHSSKVWRRGEWITEFKIANGLFFFFKQKCEHLWLFLSNRLAALKFQRLKSLVYSYHLHRPTKMRIYVDLHNIRDLREGSKRIARVRVMFGHLLTDFRRWENRRECLFPEALCYQSTNICQYLFVVNWSKAIDFQHGFNHSSKPRKHEKMLIWVEKVRTKIKNPHYGMQNNLLGIL